MSAVLSIEGLVHSYGEHSVLKGFNLELERGEILGILGPNGSGKSTAFAIVAGLQSLQGGTICYEGQSIANNSRTLRANMGVVFQSPGLDPRLTCVQNLALAARLHGISGKDAQQRIPQYLEMAALTGRANDPVKQLSGGMKRRLDLARALIHEPRLLLMDEPTSGLDEAAFRQTWDQLETMRSGRELSILVTTHRPEEGERCSRVAVLSGGKTIALSTPSALREQVANDLVILRGDDPAALQQVVQERFELPSIIDGDALLIECEKGHELIPRVVEAFPKGHLKSVSLRNPSLADVFLKLTGHALENDLGGDA